MPPSPVSVSHSNPTRCGAASGSPRAACARSRAGWTRRCILRNGTTPPDTPPIRCTSALTWSSRAVGIGLGLLAARSPDHLTAQSRPPTIDTIIIVNRNVFDLQEADAPGFIARLASRLHARTRAGVIRGTLLVNRGDRYDSARVAESERALRNLSVFSRVRIDTTRLDDRLALRVATTDGWSTKPQLGYSSAGGDVSWVAGRVEDTLLGTATSLTAVYNRTPDRGIFSLGYVNPHFFSRRVQLLSLYKGKTDGKQGTWLFGVPFFETAARRTLTTDGEAASERVLHCEDGSLVPSLDRERRALPVGMTVGFAAHATPRDYVRISFAALWRREDFDTVGAPAISRSLFGTAGAAVDVAHARFQVLERFNSYARREDVDVSQSLHVGLWVAPRGWGYAPTEAGIGTELSTQVAVPWAGGFAVLRGAGHSVFTAGAPDSGRGSGALTVASQNVPRHTLILHLEGARLRRPKFGEEFDLWSTQNGPRVFGIHQFTGWRMAWVALEDRILVADEVWGLMGVGLAPFFDYGGAWYPTEAPRLGGAVGLSFRIGPTLAVAGEVGGVGRASCRGRV